MDVGTADGIAAAVDAVAQYQRIGTTGLNLQFRHRSLQDFLDQLDTFMVKVAPRFTA